MRASILAKAIDLCMTDRCPCSRYHHFCVAFRGKRIISSSCNCVCKRHTRFAFQDSLHAEFGAISKVKDPKKPFDILVIRVNDTGTRLLISKPCSACSHRLNLDFYPINRIYYSNRDGGIVSVCRRDLLVPERIMRVKTPIAIAIHQLVYPRIGERPSYIVSF